MSRDALFVSTLWPIAIYLIAELVRILSWMHKAEILGENCIYQSLHHLINSVLNTLLRLECLVYIAGKFIMNL